MITPAEITEIKAKLETEKSIGKVYNIELKNDAGKVHAIIEKIIYIAKKKELDLRGFYVDRLKTENLKT